MDEKLLAIYDAILDGNVVGAKDGVQTALMAVGSSAVCAFVNDQLDRPCLEALAAQGVKLTLKK